MSANRRHGNLGAVAHGSGEWNGGSGTVDAPSRELGVDVGIAKPCLSARVVREDAALGSRSGGLDDVGRFGRESKSRGASLWHARHWVNVFGRGEKREPVITRGARRDCARATRTLALIKRHAVRSSRPGCLLVQDPRGRACRWRICGVLESVFRVVHPASRRLLRYGHQQCRDDRS